MSRVAIAGVVAELEADDPGAESYAAESLGDFLTGARANFCLRLECCSWSKEEGEAPGAAEFIKRESLLIMKSRGGTARFDYQRHYGVLTQARHLDLLKGLLIAVSIEYLFRDGGLILHAAGINTPQGAVVFFGPSGSGKTTLTERLRGEAGVEVISDEAVAIRPTQDGGYIAEGLPWRGRQLSAPLLGLFHLFPSPRLAFRPLGPRAFVRALSPNVYFTEPGAGQADRFLKISEALWWRAPCFQLEYSRSDTFLPHALELASTHLGAEREIEQ